MNQENKEPRILTKSEFVLFNLNLKAKNIKNGYSIRNSLISLVNFVDARHLSFANP